jgi:hypothetical protein
LNAQHLQGLHSVPEVYVSLAFSHQPYSICWKAMKDLKFLGPLTLCPALYHSWTAEWTKAKCSRHLRSTLFELNLSLALLEPRRKGRAGGGPFATGRRHTARNFIPGPGAPPRTQRPRGGWSLDAISVVSLLCQRTNPCGQMHSGFFDESIAGPCMARSGPLAAVIWRSP